MKFRENQHPSPQDTRASILQATMIKKADYLLISTKVYNWNKIIGVMTEVLINGLCFLGAFTFMEFWAWFSHKYIMHGFLWKLHKDHHFKNTEKGKAHFFEKNDFFFLIFAIPAMALIFVGLMNSLFFLVSIGLGITLYGAIYFIIHDVIIHRRLRFPALQKKRNHYIRAVLKAHAAHHIEEGNNKYISFGLLLFPKRFLKS